MKKIQQNGDFLCVRNPQYLAKSLKVKYFEKQGLPGGLIPYLPL